MPSVLRDAGPAITRRISLETVREAAKGVYRAAIRTPLVRLDVPGSARATPEIFLKLETLQPIGSFKIRGAQNAIARLSPRELGDGVWTVSAGNAAQGVALAARLAGARCSVMVMDTAPETKLRAIERLGAEIVKASYDECWQTVEQHGSNRMRGRFVHPFDDDDFISGNGTIGLEILEDVPDVDAIVAPLGGGGLLTGIGVTAKAIRPQVKIYAAEPETAAPLSVSFGAGKASRFDAWQPSFVDGAGGKSVLDGMWPLLRRGWMNRSSCDWRMRRGRCDAGGSRSCDRRRRSRVRGRSGTLRQYACSRTPQGGRRRLGRQHRSRAVRRTHTLVMTGTG